jgi:NAD dependent epimerase/dehydratase family enzyme
MNPDIAGQLTPLKLCAKRVAVGAGTQTFAGVDISDFIGNCKIVITHSELSGSEATSIQ